MRELPFADFELPIAFLEGRYNLLEFDLFPANLVALLRELGVGVGSLALELFVGPRQLVKGLA